VDTIRDNLGGFTHGFTHANGILGATVGLAVLRHLQANDLVAASASMGALFLEKLGSLWALPVVGDVRGLGLMAGVELVADRETKAPFPRADKVAEQIQAAAMARGLITYYGTGMADGVDGDAILLGPPFIITEPQIDELVTALRGAIAEVKS
jgi:adenosylmethionine-8-amino-7-oxononanoate aminotransferase